MASEKLISEVEKAHHLFWKERRSVTENALMLYEKVHQLRSKTNGEIFQIIRQADFPFNPDGNEWEEITRAFTAFDLDNGKKTPRTKGLAEADAADIEKESAERTARKAADKKQKEERRLSATAITNYIVLSAKTQASLQSQVQSHIESGWQPLGGISAAAFGISPTGGNQYIQAMVRYRGS